MGHPSWEQLPTAALVNVLVQLDFHNFLAARASCRKWRGLSQQAIFNRVWLALLERVGPKVRALLRFLHFLHPRVDVLRR